MLSKNVFTNHIFNIYVLKGLLVYWPNSSSVRQWPGRRGSIPGRVIPKTHKMVRDASMLNT